jgi:hypothetical protein
MSTDLVHRALNRKHARMGSETVFCAALDTPLVDQYAHLRNRDAKMVENLQLGLPLGS